MSTQALSTLNRAALAARQGYWWINGVALLLSVVIASMSWSAYGASDEPQRALACIVAQIVAIAMAILARRALTGQMPLAAIAALLAAGGCSWWASHGIALAWYGDQERNSEVMVVFLAALEPAIFLLAEHVREGREALRVQYEKDEAETAQELALVRERESARWGPRLAATGGLALGVMPAGAHASEVAPMLAPTPERPSIVSTNTGYASAREHAVTLKHANPALTQEQVGLRVGAPRSTVGRWLRTNSAALAAVSPRDGLIARTRPSTADDKPHR